MSEIYGHETRPVEHLQTAVHFRQVPLPEIYARLIPVHMPNVTISKYMFTWKDSIGIHVVDHSDSSYYAVRRSLFLT